MTSRMYNLCYICLLWTICCVSYVYNSDECVDKLDSYGVQDLENIVYQGTISKDAQEGDVVALNLPILARNKTNLFDDQICGYTLYKDSSYLPFRVQLLNRLTGCAQLQVDNSLNIINTGVFEFDIAPHDCSSGKHAKREHVAIKIESDTKAELSSSQLSQDSYLVEVEEAHLYKEILRLDVTYSNNEVANTCKFELLTKQVPFIIEGQGILRNTEPLSYEQNRNFILTVRLHDCGLDPVQSDSIIINIKVTEACRPGWKGIPNRIDYSPNGKVLLLGEDAHLDICDSTCTQSSVSTHIHLTTSHIGKGCDRDTYSIQSQRKLCGAASGSVDLLPNPAVSSWTRTLPTDDGHEADQIFSFDGHVNAIEIPSTKFNHSLEEHFTISTWMKHEHDTEEQLSEKQHILCNSDGEQMNRHHYALFVHNCRLVFLLRQESEGNDLNEFKPAEWRWKIPQVCDGQWHHYALSVDFPQARLYIDGKLLVVNDKTNPEVIDDWPLHPTNKIRFTKLVVGACWRGGDQNLSQYLRGYLAGLTILRGKTERDRVIQCLNNCKESLDFHAMNEMKTGMSVAFNSAMTEITINGRNTSEVQSLIRRVGYVNSRMFPTPGHRSLVIDSSVTCTDGRSIPIPDLNSMIVVMQSNNPIIVLKGMANLARDEHDFIHGQRIFPDLVITAATENQIEELDTLDEDSVEQYQLDSCIIRAEPGLDLDVEHFRLPANLMSQHDLEASLSAQNIIITGIDSLQNYATILRDIEYVSREPENLNSRTFSLTCSELNGRFVSNELRVKVDVVHTDPQQLPKAHMQESALDMQAQRIQPVEGFNEIRSSQKQSYMRRDLPVATGMGMTVIIVVCVGFLLFMIVLGVIRIRAAHQRTQVVTVDGEREMEWDNSALTIRVNPLEADAGSVYHAENELNALRHDDTDSDDDDYDGNSFQDDMDSSDEEHEKVKEKDLEWDDSTLNF